MSARPILVVEDSQEDFQTLVDAAHCAGLTHPILRANSGGECLRLLRGAARDRALLVVLDLNTHGDDGRDALREIRRDQDLKALPVVVLSGSANPRDLQFCYAQGANAYHVKPVNHSLHLEMLRAIFAYWLGSAVLPP